jgi:hypothetical protein
LQAHRIPEGFAPLGASDLRPSRPTVELLYDTIPEGIAVVAEWVRFNMLERLIGDSPETVGPILYVGNHERPGLVENWFILSRDYSGAPATHFLKLTSVEVKEPPGTTEPFFLFVGGWDHHEVPDPRTHKVAHTGALFCSYPVEYTTLLRGGAAPIDLLPPSA